jgi:hypothetical protein
MSSQDEFVVTADPDQRAAWVPTGRVDVDRLDTSIRVVGGASLLLFVSLQLPWYTISAAVGSLGLSGSASAMVAGGWRWILFLLSLAVVVYVFLRSVTSWRDPAWLHRELALVVASVLNLVMVALGAFADKPAPPLSTIAASRAGGVETAWGAWVALFAAVVAVAAAVWGYLRPPAAEPRTVRSLPLVTPDTDEGDLEEQAVVEPAPIPPGAKIAGPALPPEPMVRPRHRARPPKPAEPGTDPPTGWMPPQPPPPPPL